ncbi:MAG: HPP family protein [Magnetococcales bacterium]|nr:HPP family protein [Magnetococcales bacterium]NGZ29140.1 HPP family protein [Magnetococcales bacterium]
MTGTTTAPPVASLKEMIWSWVGSFLGISLVAILHQFWLSPQDLSLLIGSFGASAVLIYSAITSPLAQPRNLVGGHLVSGLVGVAAFQLFGSTLWLAAALAVSLAIVAMMATRTLHPPGGATALIAVIGSPELHNLGYLYALIPATLGAILMLLVALIINNIPLNRRYPLYWW